ncbi:HSP18 transcriptional regulator [Amycolatopsis panacis]|uniref:HSP18 transcriptional regulator n=1 Tax=Amycolatopsis panacis TaxID=2340917 RepID=A0A419I4U0_9PSEU|nr:HSP18 transcriptional regulator [Amycolatopsis panacis]RJQ85487.1 HSP18 transcriptional regulator [Amycolatopsis panacis]
MLNDRGGYAAVEALALVQGVLARARAGAMSSAELVAALTLLRELREELADWEPELITAARQQKVSWAALAPALGVTSRQAAERRYLRLRPSDTGERTGEERVRAQRDKRAGDRAVAAWARDNAAVLRQLAGQVSSVRGLSPHAQHHVDQVSQALAEDDPASLLPPLTDTHTHLKATHASLAAQVQSLTDQATQIRHTTHLMRSSSPPAAEH